jgi:hypothetical protein
VGYLLDEHISPQVARLLLPFGPALSSSRSTCTRFRRSCGPSRSRGKNTAVGLRNKVLFLERPA